MNGIIVYYSNYGSTKRYAEWIAEETGFALHDQRNGLPDLDGVDTVILGTPVFAMKPFLAKWITSVWPDLAERHVLLFTTSGAPAATQALRDGFRASFPAEIADRIAYFPLSGRLVWRELRPIHRLLMRIGQLIERDPTRRAAMVEDVDGTSRDAIEPLIAAVGARIEPGASPAR